MANDIAIRELDQIEMDEVNGGTVRDYLEGVATGAAIMLLFL